MEKNRYVLVTGASSGIGEATVRHLDSEGYRIVLLARRMEKMLETASHLSHESHCISYDLQDLEHIEQIFLQLRDKGIKLYGLVHCAGINRDMPVKTNDLSDMVQVMNVNLLSFVELAKYFYKKKYSEDGGAIVAMSSTAVLGCDKGMCTYSASKAGLDASVRVMSKEFAHRGIRVNSIQLNYVDTQMARETPNYEAKFAAQPLGVIAPEYVAYLTAFLLSEKARYISGSNVKMSSAAI